MRVLIPEDIHSDERRTITQLFTVDIKQVNLFEVQPGVELGNHYHKDTIEYFYVLEGKLKSNNKIMSAGDLFVYYPQENHKIKTITLTKFMTFLTKPFDKLNPDLHK